MTDNTEQNPTKTRKENFSYLDQYRNTIEELASKGVGVASIVRYLRSETNLEIPYTSVNTYMKRHDIHYK